MNANYVSLSHCNLKLIYVIKYKYQANTTYTRVLCKNCYKTTRKKWESKKKFSLKDSSRISSISITKKLVTETCAVCYP